MLKSQAVLFRASHHSASLEVELTRLNIPFVKFGGLKFLEAAHIKDVLAVLRWAQNIRDRVAGFRVAQLLPGIGPKFGGSSPRRYRGKPQRNRRSEWVQTSCGDRRALAAIRSDHWHAAPERGGLAERT
jgi:superfamily I DNA/RNA helicase